MTLVNGRPEIDDDSVPSDGRIRAVDRVCDILDVLAANSVDRPVGLAEIADQCGLPKTSAFRYLATLEARQYVMRVGDAAEYQLGMAMLNFRSGHFDSLVNVAMPRLVALRDTFGETANLGALSGDQIAYLAIVESRSSVRLAARPDDRDWLHCTALGKVIIAQLSDSRIREMIGDEYPARTYRTLTSWDSLSRDLDRVRSNGYAVDNEENELGGRCIAVPVPGVLEAALSISAPVVRFGESEIGKVAAALRETAAEIGRLSQLSKL